MIKVVKGYERCQVKLPSLQKELVRTDSKPEYPYEQVSCDLFSADSISWLMQIAYPAIRWYGSGDTIPRPWTPEYHERSDNGPQFASAAFQSFLDRWGIIWAPSTPYFASSNWHAECNVKILKHLLTKIASPDIDSEEFLEGILRAWMADRHAKLFMCTTFVHVFQLIINYFKNLYDLYSNA